MIFFFKVSSIILIFVLTYGDAFSLTKHQKMEIEAHGMSIAARDYVLKHCDGYVELKRDLKELDSLAPASGFNSWLEVEKAARNSEKYAQQRRLLLRVKKPDEKFCAEIKGNLVKKENITSQQLHVDILNFLLFATEARYLLAPLEFCENLYVPDDVFLRIANTQNVGIQSLHDLRVVIATLKKSEKYVDEIHKYEEMVAEAPDRNLFCEWLQSERPVYKSR